MEDIVPELNVLIGGENFAEIRRGKYCYIDKTGGMAAVIEVKRTKMRMSCRPWWKRG